MQNEITLEMLQNMPPAIQRMTIKSKDMVPAAVFKDPLVTDLMKLLTPLKTDNVDLEIDQWGSLASARFKQGSYILREAQFCYNIGGNCQSVTWK